MWPPSLPSLITRVLFAACLCVQSLGLPRSPARVDAVWVVILMRSGRFAGAVFEGSRVLAHKVR